MIGHEAFDCRLGSKVSIQQWVPFFICLSSSATEPSTVHETYRGLPRAG